MHVSLKALLAAAACSIASVAAGQEPGADRPPVDTRLNDRGAPLRQVPQGGQTFAGPFSAAPPPGAPSDPDPASGRSSYAARPATAPVVVGSPYEGVVQPGFGLTCTARASACPFRTGRPLGSACVCPTADGAGDPGSVGF